MTDSPNPGSPEAVALGIDAALVGGNHLASLLIGWLGADFPEWYPVTDDPRSVAERMGYGPAFDVWCGWRGIMRLRALATPVQQEHTMPVPPARSGMCPTCGTGHTGPCRAPEDSA
jgi:hypothetical protein